MRAKAANPAPPPALAVEPVGRLTPSAELTAALARLLIHLDRTPRPAPEVVAVRQGAAARKGVARP